MIIERRHTRLGLCEENQGVTERKMVLEVLRGRGQDSTLEREAIMRMGGAINNVAHLWRKVI